VTAKLGTHKKCGGEIVVTTFAALVVTTFAGLVVTSVGGLVVTLWPA
jgi:hypothetical protein